MPMDWGLARDYAARDGYQQGEMPVTEEDWFLESDPTSLLLFLRGRASERKLRLVAASACRKVWNLLFDGRSRDAVELVEHTADEATDNSEFGTVAAAAREAEDLAYSRWEAAGDRDVAQQGPRYWAASAVVHAATPSAADGVRDAVTYAAMALAWSENARLATGPDYWSPFIPGMPWDDLIREVFGNPFRPVIVHGQWWAGQGGAMSQFAPAAYEERRLPEGTLDPLRLSQLADALEDAGCTDAELLGHLRGPGPHVRGCWAVDLVLGKS
jgi:hypothetical protein